MITLKNKEVTAIDMQELKGKILILKGSYLHENYRTPENQFWLAKDGFGTNPMCHGTGIAAISLKDNEPARWERDEFIGIASEALVKQYFPNYEFPPISH